MFTSCVVGEAGNARKAVMQKSSLWGCFLLPDGESSNLGEFKAYLPSVVSSRVCNIAKKMPNDIQLKISTPMNYWPKTFEKFSPVYDRIFLVNFSLLNLTGRSQYKNWLMCYCKVMPKLANFGLFWWLCSSSEEVTFRADWRRHGSYSQIAMVIDYH